ncbi:MAG TPA: PilN domain-containing protein [Armatimonadota bacterium]|nr:PilN domain-containing protein [Armatimonadota bacterium]
MPRVNLITERRKRERRDEGIARVLVYGCASIAAAFLLVFVLMTTRKYRLSGDIDSESQQLTSLQPRIAEVKNLQQLETTLTPRLDLLQTAKDSTTHWYLIYQQTGQGLPASTWLDTMTVNSAPGEKDQPDKMTLILAGQSLTQDTVAETITQLQRQPMFQSVELHFVRNDTPVQSTGGPVPSNTPPHTTHFEVAVQLKDLRPESSAERAEELASAAQTANAGHAAPAGQSSGANPSAISSPSAISNPAAISSPTNGATRRMNATQSTNAGKGMSVSKNATINGGAGVRKSVSVIKGAGVSKNISAMNSASANKG